MVEPKNVTLQKLKNVKLIIGNGYDLYCGLKTKYSDYFDSNKEKNESINEWMNRFQDRVQTYSNIVSKIPNREDFWVNLKGFESINFWDVLFYIESEGDLDGEKPIRWCDVESTILKWLESKTDKYSSSPRKGLSYIYDYFNGTRPYEGLDFSIYLLASFLIRKNGVKGFGTKQDYYNVLLNELKKFECDFGKYVSKQQFGPTDSPFRNASYFNHSGQLVGRLCSIELLSSVDTFNYSEPFLSDSNLSHLVHHINGDTENPIFGVDSDAFITTGRELDARYIFTKTYRRMELDMIQGQSEELKPFENVVIYGCSLAPADYSYFFTIFDKLNITDINNSSKIVFAFSIYDEDRRNEIKSQLVKSVFELFQEYSRYKGSLNHPNRLVDSLTAQGKIVLYRIPI